jgi:V8-like Glu-specific endopeptidase
MWPLERILENASQALNDLDEKIELHSMRPAGGGGKVTFGALGPARTGPPTVSLASLPGKAHRELLKKFADAGTNQRKELARTEHIRLYSIVFANFRPGPAFLAGHQLAADALNARIEPGGETWQTRVANLACSSAAFAKNIATHARQCARLDTRQGIATGSGTVLSDGSILTANHVIHSPGWLFGNPPDAQPARLLYNQVNGKNTAVPEINLDAIRRDDHEDALLDAAQIAQPGKWRETFAASSLAAEFGELNGLQLQTEAISTADLQRRPVAVIGHPVSGNAGGDPSDIALVFGDAPLKLKRFMPGFLDPATPIVRENGRDLLCHDCSTLGGASGACLIDLKTGRILGIHVAGNTALANRAVPAWNLAPSFKPSSIV